MVRRNWPLALTLTATLEHFRLNSFAAFTMQIFTRQIAYFQSLARNPHENPNWPIGQSQILCQNFPFLFSSLTHKLGRRPEIGCHHGIREEVNPRAATPFAAFFVL